MSERRASSPGAGTTAESKSTARPNPNAFQWAVHWVFPQAKVTPLTPGDCTIGRDPACGCVLTDTEVSREHAVLRVAALTCSVIDLRSRNGIQVDAVRVSDAPLRDGSVLRLGGSVGVVVHSPDAAVLFSELEHGGPSRCLGSGKLKRVLDQARALSALAEPVSIHGESGSGKEAIAELLHRASARRGALIPLNCSTLRGDLSLAALFGHVKGAFSGADRASEGAVRAAQDGTLFLDEIAELPDVSQPLLLRLLQNAVVTPVGSSKPVPVNARVVSATHQDLFLLCREGRFREDLYYRLTTHELRLPALRERREDILGLFLFFASRSSSGLSVGFVESLLLQPFAGNVRELANLCARLRVAASGNEIWHAHLLAANAPITAANSSKPAEPDWAALHQQYGGVANRIAIATGIPVSTVKRQLAKLGLR